MVISVTALHIYRGGGGGGVGCKTASFKTTENMPFPTKNTGAISLLLKIFFFFSRGGWGGGKAHSVPPPWTRVYIKIRCMYFMYSMNVISIQFC